MPQLPIADLLGDLDQFPDQLPEAVVFLQLSPGSLHGGSNRDDPGRGFAGYRPGERVGRAVALGAFLGAVASGLATLAEAGH